MLENVIKIINDMAGTIYTNTVDVTIDVDQIEPEKVVVDLVEPIVEIMIPNASLAETNKPVTCTEHDLIDDKGATGTGVDNNIVSFEQEVSEKNNNSNLFS